MIKIFNIYLIKRSFYFSFTILIFFGLLDSIFTFISELENISSQFNIFIIFKHVIFSMPHNCIQFLEGACLLGVILALGISHQEGNLNVLRSAGESPLKIIFISSIGALMLAIPLIAFDEISFRKIYLNSEANKNILSQKNVSSNKDITWIKSDNSYLSFENIIDDDIFNVRFIKTDNNEIVYTASANSAKVSENKIVFSNNTLYKNFANDSLKTKSEIFTIPIQSKVALKNINHLGIKNIYSYQKIFSESILEKDVLFKAHLDKVFYRTIFIPISIMALIMYFGSLIFTSLRDSTVGGRIVVAVIGAFIYKLLQDLSIGVFISYGFPVYLGVILPSIILFFMSIRAYQKI